MRKIQTIALAAGILALFSRVGPLAADAPDPYPCRARHTFDFWVGDFAATPWDKPDALPTGRLHNTREYDGCVIVERWTGRNSTGMSMSFYDPNRRAWRMVWVSDNGTSDDLEGEYRDGAMRFHGWVLNSAGRRVLVTNVLEKVSADTIRHVYSESDDGGKSWTVKSDGRFSRQKE